MFCKRQVEETNLGEESVSYLNVGASPGLAHHVLGLEVQVDDVLLVHVAHALADLAHVVRRLRLRHAVAGLRDALEQLAARQAGG